MVRQSALFSATTKMFHNSPLSDSIKKDDVKDAAGEVGGMFKVISKSQRNNIDGNGTKRMLLISHEHVDELATLICYEH